MLSVEVCLDEEGTEIFTHPPRELSKHSVLQKKSDNFWKAIESTLQLHKTFFSHLKKTWQPLKIHFAHPNHLKRISINKNKVLIYSK